MSNRTDSIPPTPKIEKIQNRDYKYTVQSKKCEHKPSSSIIGKKN